MSGDPPGVLGRVPGSRQWRLLRHHRAAVYDGSVQFRAGLFAAERVLLTAVRLTRTERNLLRSDHHAMHNAGVFAVTTLRRHESDLCSHLPPTCPDRDVL